MTLRRAPTPYPAEYYQIDRWQGHPFYRWANVSDGPIEDWDDVIQAVIEAFKEGPTRANLRTVKVVYHNGAFYCDATKDALRACGSYLAARHTDTPFPPQFEAWAGPQPQQKRSA